MIENEFEIFQTTETSALIEFGSEINPEVNKKIRIFCSYLDNNPFKGMVEYIPAFCSVSVIYNPLELPYSTVYSIIKDIILNLDFNQNFEKHIVKIPVCYGGEFGPDIQNVAKLNSLTTTQVIKIHSDSEYLVYMIGFAPGFPYLGGMSEKIATPRLNTPRQIIPSGSVGIAGMQTGVYPMETPGGWQLIGRTPLKLFDINKKPKSLLSLGDIVKFYPVSYQEYLKLQEDK